MILLLCGRRAQQAWSSIDARSGLLSTATLSGRRYSFPLSVGRSASAAHRPFCYRVLTTDGGLHCSKFKWRALGSLFAHGPSPSPVPSRRTLGITPIQKLWPKMVMASLFPESDGTSRRVCGVAVQTNPPWPTYFGPRSSREYPAG